MQRLLLALTLWIFTTPLAFSQPSWGWQGPWPESADQPRLGVLVNDLPFHTLDSLELPYGLRVERVLPDSAAETAGIQPDDILLTLDGKPLFSAARLQWLISEAKPDKPLELTYDRSGETAKTQVDLQASVGQAPRPLARFGDMGPSYLGVGLQPLTQGLREALEAPENTGMLVAEVVENSPADQADLRPGDVIVRMDRRPVRSMADVWRVLDYFQPGEKMELELIRDKQTRQLTVTLGERKHTPFRSDWYPGPGRYPGHRPFMIDPGWWRDMGELMERWQEHFEPPPGWDWAPRNTL